MKLLIPDKVSWVKNILSDNLAHYNQNTAKRVLKTHTNHERDGIFFEIQPITIEILDWFVPLYKEKISTKNSPLLIDLYSKTLFESKKKFYMLMLLENGTRIGGVIFSETETTINIAYKIFDDKWVTSTLPAGPSLYADYLLCEYGLTVNKTLINHGKDRNGYGKSSSIGLAIFKISLGYKPQLPKKFIQTEIETDNIDCDSLYFTFGASPSDLLGNLFTTSENKEKWSRLNSYSDKVPVSWVLR